MKRNQKSTNDNNNCPPHLHSSLTFDTFQMTHTPDDAHTRRRTHQTAHTPDSTHQ